MVTQRDPDMIRVSKRQLQKVLADLLAPKRVAAVVEILEASPEGDIFDGPIPDEARTLARLDLERKRKRRSA